MREEHGELTDSCDEMKGIQAPEHTMSTIAMKSGHRARIEFKYICHGIQTLIAAFNVATGRIDQARVGNTRTEQDLAAHLQTLLSPSPKPPKIYLVMNCLNTHQSEALVRLAADFEEEPLGYGGEALADPSRDSVGSMSQLDQKGKSGILKSMAKPFQWNYTGKPLTS